MNWEFSKSIAGSKLVKSSYVWLIITPLAAKFLESLENPINIKLFGQNFKLNLDLPFSWESLFYAAVAFTLANLVYQFFCPPILKKYSSYKEYREEGNTPRTANYAIKAMKYNREKAELENYDERTRIYVTDYMGGFSSNEPKIQEYSFDDVGSQKDFNKSAEAFYLAREIANDHFKFAAIISAGLYSIGFIFIIAIVIENLSYVLGSSGIINSSISEQVPAANHPNSRPSPP